jgi:hypothetical protein
VLTVKIFYTAILLLARLADCFRLINTIAKA